MAKSSLSYIRLSPQEITALKGIIPLAVNAFEKADFPMYYDAFLIAIHQIIQLGSAAMLRSASEMEVEYNIFSKRIDALSGFLREMMIIKSVN